LWIFNIAIIRSQVKRRIPGALTVYERKAPKVFPTAVFLLLMVKPAVFPRAH
jgi:hypothetical protein